MQHTWLCVGVLCLVGCGDDPTWVGTWQVTTTWDVRGPFSAEHTVGDAVAEIVLGKIVALTPVPSFLEEDLFALLHEAAGADIQQAVDSGAPAELGPGGSVTLFLSQSLAAVRTTSRLVLEEATLDDLEGEETLSAMTVELPGEPVVIDIHSDAIAPAVWSGDISGDRTLAIDPHPVPLQYGALLTEVLLHEVDLVHMDSLRAGVLAALDCATVVDAMLGGAPGFDVTLADWTHTIAAADFAAACDQARGAMSDRVLGLFAADTAVLVGGELTWTDGDIPTLTATFSGILDVAPAAVAPRIGAALTGSKQ